MRVIARWVLPILTIVSGIALCWVSKEPHQTLIGLGVALFGAVVLALT